MPKMPIILADITLTEEQRAELTKNASEETATGAEKPIPIPRETSPALPILIAVFALAAIAAVVLISLKGRRGASPGSGSGSEPG